MNFAFCYLFVLIWLAYMIASGVLLFSRGFLLSRVSKQDISHCRQLSANKNDNNFINEELVGEIFRDVNASSNLCLPQKSKVIVLVIDALKYEFGVYRENATKILPYENKLSVLHDLLKASPNHARLMRFKADPPTTTLQRLKGLTTGSLPTFIDIGSNFASPEINEDNIIDQMVRHNLPIVFMGDSTWTDLYPKRFRRSYSYPSFDIFDLDTVDTNIQKHLPVEMTRGDWQVLIAHFLGVDHCGHRYGPMHKEMERKLNEMNSVIKSVVANMDDETTLFVIGDHGMTISGDHGGDTDDETNALLFAYSKHHKFLSSDWGSSVDMLQQIDFVPTLATILGIPIPYSNLGLVNFNLVPDVLVPHTTKLQVVLLHAWHNAQQIFTYFYNYALENKNTFSVDDMDRMETEYILLSHRVKTIYNEAAFKSFVADLNAHLRLVLNTCRELWVRFDATQMSHGLLLTIMPVCFMFLLINNSRATELYKIFTPRQVLYTYLLNVAAGVFGYRYYKDFAFKSEEHAVIFCTNLLSIVILIVHTIQNWANIVGNWSNQPPLTSMSTRLIVVGMVGIFFSNSFIIQEAKILSYLLSAVLLHQLVALLKRSFPVEFRTRVRVSSFLRSLSLKLMLATFLAIMLLRSCYNLFRCREEQGDCVDFNSNTGDGFSLKTAGSGRTYVLAVVIVVIYTTLTRLYLRSCGNLTGNSVNVLLARYGPTVASICVGGHILLSNSSLKTIQRSHIDAMALVVFALLALQLLVFALAPMMAYVLPPRDKQIVVSDESSIVPEIFKKMKRMYEGNDAERKYEIPVVYGLATIYSSIIITFGIFLTIFVLVLLAPKATMGLVICITVGAILLTMHSILRFRTAHNFETCIQPTFTAVVGWFLLAQFTFFATSHQTTLSQIDWRAAFVGRTSNAIGQSQLVSATLVIISTFCGQFIFFSMFGLLATETFSLYALFPDLVRNNRVRDNRGRGPDSGLGNQQLRSLSEISMDSVGFDMTRGELTLFENEAIFLGTAFKLAVQFFMLQGIKVFCAMLACTIHARHLMVWKIFAPRFIYEGLSTFVSLPALVLGYLLYVRVHFAVDKLITKINKIK